MTINDHLLIRASSPAAVRNARLHPEPFCPCWNSWGWFNGDGIQRCDERADFPDDDAAELHVLGCAPCQAQLARTLLAEVMASIVIRHEEP